MQDNGRTGLAITSVIVPVILPALGGLIFGSLGLIVGLISGGIIGLVFALYSLPGRAATLARAGLVLSSIATVVAIALFASMFWREGPMRGGPMMEDSSAPGITLPESRSGSSSSSD